MYFGQSIKRKEDRRFVRGEGQYVDDMTLPGTAAVVFVRSIQAHARLGGVDVAAAREMPGVLAVLTGSDWTAAGLGKYVCWSAVITAKDPDRPQITQPILALDSVHYVGQPIALVVAETLDQAQDAAEMVAVDYEPLPPLTDTAHALDPDAPVLHAKLESNLIFDYDTGDKSATEAAFATAAHITELKLINNRVTAASLEPRICLARYERGTDHYTLWVSHQAPHMLRRDLAENTLLHPEERIRIVSPDVGGGFGMKVANHPEEPATLWAAKVVDRPVRWVSTRSEAFISDAQARDHVTKARMALDANGRILAIEVDTLASLGAFQTRMGAAIPSQFFSRALVSLYKTAHIYCRVRGVHTNTPPVQAYRGAGRPEAAHVVDSLLDNAAHELGIDICELRERNFIPAEEFPYKTPLGLTYDSGDPKVLMSKGKSLFGYDDLRAEQERRRGERVLLGIGGSCFMDCIGAPSREAYAFGRRKVGGWDSATARIHPSGNVSVMAGSHSHGQGHATTFAQIAADAIGCPIEVVEVVEGDTDRVQYGHGTWGSRSTITSGMAVHKASVALGDKLRRIAAHVLECGTDEILYEQGIFRAPGTNRQASYKEMVEIAYQGGNLPEGMEPALEVAAFYEPKGRSYASGLHLCAVEVDTDTGVVTVRHYTSIDDCGRLINPVIVDGQAHGGIAQGLGQALMEHCVFDRDTGQPTSGSFMDYAMPRAADFPMFRVGFHETPTETNALGVKGAGESGTIGALAAVRNAVVDALWHLGVRHIDMPMTPLAVWTAVQSARGS